MDSSLCNASQLSKHTCLPFYDSHSLSVAPIHCDIRTSPVLNKTGYKYYMVLIDNYKHYIWVYPLKFKSETFHNDKKFHKLIQTQFNRTIKTF